MENLIEKLRGSNTSHYHDTDYVLYKNTSWSFLNLVFCLYKVAVFDHEPDLLGQDLRHEQSFLGQKTVSITSLRRVKKLSNHRYQGI